MEDRKTREGAFHDELHGRLQAAGDPKYTAYQKWYAAGMGAIQWLYRELERESPGKLVLDYACGDGPLTRRLSRLGARAVGIDVSSASLALGRQAALNECVPPPDFVVMDAEHTAFPDSVFDLVVCSGVLHHMDLETALREIHRVLKPTGKVIAVEPLGYNPLINWYRRRTPYLRSADERALTLVDVGIARGFFENVTVSYFNLATLLAAPLWRTPLVGPVRAMLGLVDSALLRVPIVQRQAWMVGIRMATPRKG